MTICSTTRKLLLTSLILAIAFTIVGNLLVIYRLFLNKSRHIPTTLPQVGAPFISFRKRLDNNIRTINPLLPALSLNRNNIATSGSNSAGKLWDVQNVKTTRTTGVLSDQTLPSKFRSGMLIKPGTRDESVMKKLMSIRRHRIVNPHEYTYRINPSDACNHQKVEVVMCVVTAVNNFHLRRQVRYGINGGYAGIWNQVNSVVLLFFLGTPSGENYESLQAKVDNESISYGDIVQATYIDTYRNLSIKTVSILKWVSSYCSNANFVIKTDDDCDVNIPLMVTELHRKQQEIPLFILGKVSRKLSPVRVAKSKWYISRSIYKEDKYPTFMYGGSQGYPTEVAKLLYEASLRIPTFFLEDVYISGLCANMLNIPRIDCVAFYFSHIPRPGEVEY